MKKIILSIVALVAFGVVSAQKDMKFGVRGGLDMVSYSASGASTSLTGFFVGGFAEFAIADKMVLQPGLN